VNGGRAGVVEGPGAPRALETSMAPTRPLVVVLLLALPSAVPAPAALAESSLLCPGTSQRIRYGDHVTRVLESCGEPDFASGPHLVQYRTKHIIRAACKGSPEVTEERVVEVMVDDWVYENGLNQRTFYLRFENDLLRGLSTRWVGSR
jgi:hypothetical protein